MKKTPPAARITAFSVEHFSLSTYATQELNGKFTIAGMFSDQVLIPEKATNWPPLYIVLILIPNMQQFSYNVALRDDLEEEMILFEATYLNKNKVDERERLALCVPLPQFPMKKHGTYWFEISDGSETILKRAYEVVSVEPTDVKFGEQTLKVRIGATGQTRVLQ